MMRNIRLITFIALFCTISYLNGTLAQSGTTKILFIGNSYTHMNSMPKIFDKMVEESGQDMEVVMSAASGHSFRMHCEREKMFKTIKSKKWDYVILQGFSRELSFQPEYIDTASVPFIARILDSIYKNNSCTNVMLYMTWGYKNGWEERPEINSFDSMSDSVRKGYEYISKRYDLPIVPVGGVWKEVMHDTLNYIGLHAEDDQHPTLAGSFLIASTFYAALFKNLPAEKFSGKLDKEDALYLRNKAYDYVLKYVDTFKLSRNTIELRIIKDEPKELVIEAEANYPAAKAYHWDLGNGKEILGAKISHAYLKPGTYKITLEVHEACGTRVEHRNVECKPRRKFRRKRPLCLKDRVKEKS